MAWEVLIARHNHRVVVSVVALGLRPEAARDITQEAWIRLIEQQRRGALSELTLPGARPGSWRSITVVDSIRWWTSMPSGNRATAWIQSNEPWTGSVCAKRSMRSRAGLSATNTCFTTRMVRPPPAIVSSPSAIPSPHRG